jgi:hypothetical protein
MDFFSRNVSGKLLGRYHVMSIDVLRFIGIVIVRDIMGIEFVRPFFWYNEDIFWSIASLDELFVGKIGG